MDLVQQLIRAKKDKQDIPFYETLSELCKYEKLSRNKKFEHITDSPILQKQMPHCWSAFQGDSQAFWLLTECATILQNIAPRRLTIFDDIEQYHDDRKRKQIAIIGNITQHQIEYEDLRRLPKNIKDLNAIYIYEEISEKEINTTILWLDGNTTTVYTGIMKRQIEEKQLPVADITAHKYTKGNDTVIIDIISNQGNNDYDFAETNEFKVSMPKYDQLKYQQKEADINGKIVFPPVYVDIDEDDARMYSLYRDDLDVISEIILKYKPKAVEPRLMQAMNDLKEDAQNEN